MKHIKILLLIFASALFMLSSCGEDFLYKSPQGSIDKAALENQVGVDLLTTTAYANLTQHSWGASPFNWTFGGMYGGDANKGSDANDQSILNEMETYNILPTNGYISEKWAWIYKGAKRVNIALQVLENVEDVPEQYRKGRVGELHFLRALFYFEGIKVFGPYIPWVDETVLENDPKIHNDIDIYPKVLADIDIAIQNLPDVQDQPGRANSWAAKALKAKILMQKNDMATAKPILKDVIDNGKTSKGLKYGLEDNMDHNFSSYHDNGKESIFAVQFSGERDNGNMGMSLCYPHGGSGVPGGCCGFYQPSNELANSYKVDANGLPLLDNSYRAKPYVTERGTGEDVSINNDVLVDPRIDFAIGRIGIPYKDWGPAKGNWVRDVANGGFYLPKKHVYTKEELDAGLAGGGLSAGWAPGSAINLQYLSLRDVMLMYAECLANDEDLPGAMNMVNQIRTRAALPINTIMLNGAPAANYKIGLYPSFPTKDYAIKAIRMERKLELAMEGLRWFDLTRWGGDYMNRELSAYINFEKEFIAKFQTASILPASKTTFPLPEGQIQTMGTDEDGKPYLEQKGPWK